MVVYRGIDSTTAIDGTPTSAGQTATQTVTIPSLTPTVPGDRLVLVQGAVPSAAGTWSIPVGTTPRGVQQQTAGGSAAGLITDQRILTTAPSGPRTINFSTSGAVVGVALVLKPARTIYGYDARGNRTSVTPPGGSATSLTYDQADRLKTHGSTASYTYDGDGARLSKTVSGLTTTFTQDGGGRTLVEGTTKFVYGPGGLPLESITSTDVIYYHHDEGGSTRALTNSSGVVVATYTYDTNGNTTASTGTAVNPLLYNSQYTDNESGLIFQGGASDHWLSPDGL